MRQLSAALVVLILLTAGSVMHVFAAASSTTQPSARELAVGDKVPLFSLANQDGKPFNLADDQGKITVLEWVNPQCPYVQRHYREKTMETLASKYAGKDVAWVAINSTPTATNADNETWVKTNDLTYPILNDSRGAIGKEYGATNTPNMFIISKDGKLLYRGAIDNDPEGEMKDGRVNYVSKALDEILAGKPVSTPETKPYGCGVKYSD